MGATMQTHICRRLLLAAVLCCSCSNTQGLGSRYVAEQTVTASQGGTLTVAAADSPELAGTQLQIPAGALAADTHITLELGSTALVQGHDHVAGVVAIWG